jgi:hypothetical protein
MTFVYDDEKHEYRLDGRKLVSVTGVLKAAGLLDQIWPDDDARWRGEATHKAVELYAKGTLDPATVDPRIQPRLDAFAKFQRDTGFRMIESEKPYYNPAYNLACKPDLFGIFPDGSEGLVEIKSGGLAKWVRLQVAGQDITLGGGRPRSRWGLSLAGGKPSVQRYNDPDDISIFMSAMNVAHWKIKYANWRDHD